MRKIVKAAADKCRMPERYLLEKVVWPLNRSHGHAYNAFKNEMSDRNTVLHELELPQAVHDALFDSIYFEMSKAISKVDPIKQCITQLSVQAALQSNQEMLDLSQWGLKTLPSCFLELSALRTLNLESNKLVTPAPGCMY